MGAIIKRLRPNSQPRVVTPEPIVTPVEPTSAPEVERDAPAQGTDQAVGGSTGPRTPRPRATQAKANHGYKARR